MDSMFFVPSDSNGVFSSAIVETSKQRAGFGEDDDWNLLKMGKNGQMLTETSKTSAFLVKSSSFSSFPNGEKMLSFSSPLPMSSSSSPLSLPFYPKNGGMVYGNPNVSINGVRGGFTANQWIELEQQALIYKYIHAKIPVPSSLVIPIRRSIHLPGFHSFTSGSCRSGTLRYGPYTMGFTGNGDPEPGRCRRTDGKKWRCSRDAVGDQKYCERHINRGRHRSRKHVEGHGGHGEKAITPISSQSASVVSDGSSSNLAIAQQMQSKGLHPSTMESSCTQFDRIFMNKRNVTEQAQDSQNTLFPTFKPQNSFEGILQTSNSDKRIVIPQPEIHVQQSKSHPLLHFIDDYPKKTEMVSDRTQLSISTPMDSSEYSSSPIRLVRDCGRLEDNKRNLSCVNTSWDDPMMGGGPLGEVLTKKSRITENHNINNYSPSSLNLLATGWDSSLRLDSSPTGVLQKNCCFISLSSSTGSSPRAERQT